MDSMGYTERNADSQLATSDRSLRFVGNRPSIAWYCVISLMGAHHHQCRGDAFFMLEDRPFQMSIDSRIMVDAAFFRKMNPNYSRPRIIEPAKLDLANGAYHFLGGEDNSTKEVDKNH